MASGLENTCTCRVCQEIRHTIVDICSILNKYGWLVDSYIIDFFHEDLWGKLPNSWAKILENMEPEELGSWILEESGSRHVWPLSLLALRQLIKKLSINRNPDEKSALICKETQWNHQLLENSANYPLEGIILKDKKVTKFQNLFIKHVKKKKRYEIEKFSQHCSGCAKLTGCNCIVDTGAGMGHLARELAYKYHLPVICVEQDKNLSDMARKYDEDFIYNLRKHFSDFCGQPPYHLCAKIVEESCTGSQLVERFNEILTTNFSYTRESNDFGLIGLHPCGDLAARLLRFYINQEASKFINIVGCCYMKLTTSTSEGSPLGYPLSSFVSGIPQHSLTYEALEVACHAIENYCDKMTKNSYDDLKVHAFRATLEAVLIQRGGTGVKHGRIGSVRLKDHMSFSEYCKLATAPLSPEKQLDEFDMSHPTVISYLDRWKQVVIFEGLRMMLAPLVETLVLLDRFLFLSEHNLKPMLKAEFDPRLSPRNFVLTSTK